MLSGTTEEKFVVTSRRNVPFLSEWVVPRHDRKVNLSGATSSIERIRSCMPSRRKFYSHLVKRVAMDINLFPGTGAPFGPFE
jgi:hypothetical protein